MCMYVVVQMDAGKLEPVLDFRVPKDVDGQNDNATGGFSYRELATATKNFRGESLIGEGGFGPVYKGQLERTGQVINLRLHV